MLQLFKCYCLANIPLEYQTFDWVNDYPDNEHRERISKYIENFETVRMSGYGWEIMGKKLGVGKAQPVDEPVLTPHGWRAIGDLQVGDQVISGDGTPTNVVGVFPQEGLRPIYEVEFSDGATTRCDADHLWRVRTNQDASKENEFRVMSLTEIINSGVSASWSENPNWKPHWSNYKWRIPTVGAVEFDSIDPDYDGYLIGALIGDGSLCSATPRFSNHLDDVEIVEEMRRVLSAPLEMKSSRVASSARVPSYTISTSPGQANPLSAHLKELGLIGTRSHEKFIPHPYLTSSIEQRKRVLAGLLDTDGWTVKGRSGAQFGTSSEQLALDVQSLVRSLGGSATLRHKKVRKYAYKGEVRSGRPAWELSIRLPFNPFLLSRKRDGYEACGIPEVRDRTIRDIREVSPSQAVCIAVDHPSHTYVTKDFVVTHNTCTAAHIAKALAVAGYSVWFVQFMEVKSLYELDDPAERDRKTRKLLDSEFLVIDDILKPRSDKMRAFFEDKLEEVVRHRTSRNLPTVTTTNMLEDDLEKLFPRIYSLMSAKQFRITLSGEDARIERALEDEDMILSGEVRPLT